MKYEWKFRSVQILIARQCMYWYGSHKIKLKIAKHSYHCLNNKYSAIIAKTNISLSYYSFMVNEVIIQNFNIQLISQIIQINNKRQINSKNKIE